MFKLIEDANRLVCAKNFFSSTASNQCLRRNKSVNCSRFSNVFFLYKSRCRINTNDQYSGIEMKLFFVGMAILLVIVIIVTFRHRIEFEFFSFFIILNQVCDGIISQIVSSLFKVMSPGHLNDRIIDPNKLETCAVRRLRFIIHNNELFRNCVKSLLDEIVVILTDSSSMYVFHADKIVQKFDNFSSFT